jgi:dTDP-glucose pyrophosphorylase
MKRKIFSKAILKKSNSINEAIENLANTGLQICFICEGKKLIGTITDGDIRRAILKKKNLETQIKEIMNKKFISIKKNSSPNKAKTLMNYYKINQIPAIDKNKNLSDVFFSETIGTSLQYENPVIIMAGGFGKRLMPLTKNCPKPLLPVLGKPVIEHIIIKLKNEGFKNIFISTHYLANMIKEYFGNGKDFGVSINYIDEKTPLGTAGCLSQFKSNNNKDFIVCNGDVLTDIPFPQLLEYHLKNKSTATMAVREYFWQHPFGVIKTNGIKIRSITEKPVEKTYVNAGIYVFKNKIKKILKKNKKIAMPEFFRLLKKKKYNTIVFPMFEKWLDIGNTKEYELAQKKYN